MGNGAVEKKTTKKRGIGSLTEFPNAMRGLEIPDS